MAEPEEVERSSDDSWGSATWAGRAALMAAALVVANLVFVVGFFALGWRQAVWIGNGVAMLLVLVVAGWLAARSARANSSAGSR